MLSESSTLAGPANHVVATSDHQGAVSVVIGCRVGEHQRASQRVRLGVPENPNCLLEPTDSTLKWVDSTPERFCFGGKGRIWRFWDSHCVVLFHCDLHLQDWVVAVGFLQLWAPLVAFPCQKSQARFPASPRLGKLGELHQAQQADPVTRSNVVLRAV